MNYMDFLEVASIVGVTALYILIHVVAIRADEEKIRKDERRKFISFIAEHTLCRTDCENFLNCDGKKCWNKYLDMYEKERKNG